MEVKSVSTHYTFPLCSQKGVKGPYVSETLALDAQEPIVLRREDGSF